MSPTPGARGSEAGSCHPGPTTWRLLRLQGPTLHHLDRTWLHPSRLGERDRHQEELTLTGPLSASLGLTFSTSGHHLRIPQLSTSHQRLRRSPSASGSPPTPGPLGNWERSETPQDSWSRYQGFPSLLVQSSDVSLSSINSTAMCRA